MYAAVEFPERLSAQIEEIGPVAESAELEV